MSYKDGWTLLSTRVKNSLARRGALVLAGGLWLVWGLTTSQANPATTQPDPKVYQRPLTRQQETPLDTIVFNKLEQLRLPTPALCSDAVFLRRVYLDVIGTLPTAPEAREFLESKNPKKRSLLIEQLLAREEFADYWAMKWGDLLRVKAEFPINLWPNAVQAYAHSIHTAIKENKPYDRWARELLTANGSNFRVPEVNFYRAVPSKEPAALAQAVALTFMGARAEAWPPAQWSNMALFFSQMSYKATKEWKEEIVYWNPEKNTTTAPATAPAVPAAAVVWKFPDGTPAPQIGQRDPREVFADWLITEQNPWFTRNIANRAWFWLLGRGIIHEPDDIRPDNPPSNPELLAYLQRELVAAKYDLKALFRVILNSNTYQLSSVTTAPNPRAEANFAAYPLRRLEAEVLIDALGQVTGTSDKYSSPIPEPFTFIPEGARAITLADGSITSPFLELFGRSSRDTGRLLERNNRISSAQQLHLLNSSHVQRKLESGKNLQDLLQARRSHQETLNELYLTILSRYPTADEQRIAEAYLAKTTKRDASMDITWSLINSAEFLYRH